jgi:hypothetical protein
MKKYLTEIYVDGKVYGSHVWAEDWLDAVKNTAMNELVVGEFVEEITLEEN